MYDMILSVPIRSFFFAVLLAAILAISGCGWIGNSQVRLGEEFYLSPGQRVHIAGENLKVEFKEVTEDSRCPRGATCIWAGRVVCALELTHAGVSKQISLTKTGLTDEYARERWEGFEFTFQVTPYPQVGEKISKDEYRLHLTINKLND